MSAARSRVTLVVVALIIQLFILPITNIDKYALWKRSEGARSLQPEFDDTEIYHRYTHSHEPDTYPTAILSSSIHPWPRP